MKTEAELVMLGIEALNLISKNRKLLYTIAYNFNANIYSVRMMGKSFYSTILLEAIKKCIKFVSVAEGLLSKGEANRIKIKKIKANGKQ